MQPNLFCKRRDGKNNAESSDNWTVSPVSGRITGYAKLRCTIQTSGGLSPNDK